MARLICEIVMWSLAFVGVILLFVHQCRVQMLEWRFYRNRHWDMSEDSGIDRVDVLSAMWDYKISAPKMRFVLIRPLFLIMLIGLMAVMVVNWM
jgi:hypothetical protein